MKTYWFEKTQESCIEDFDADVDVSLVDEAQEKQNDDLIFDSKVLEDDVMHVEANRLMGKDNTKYETMIVPVDEGSLLTTGKRKVVTTAATTATTTRPKDKGVVVQEPSEFRVTQEIKPSSSKEIIHSNVGCMNIEGAKSLQENRRKNHMGSEVLGKLDKEGKKVVEETTKVAEEVALKEKEQGKNSRKNP
ncbi:hypothetical protein Tco_0777517 [Tanacetum coccineum]